MQNNTNWFVWLTNNFRNFLNEATSQPSCKIVEIYECTKSGHMKAVIKLTNRHIIEKNICDIIIDDDLIEFLDRKTIRALTYIATLDKLNPDFTIISQKVCDDIDDYLFQIYNRKTKSIISKSLSDISNDKSILKNFNSSDASRISYLSGVFETVKEFKFK